MPHQLGYRTSTSGRSGGGMYSISSIVEASPFTPARANGNRWNPPRPMMSSAGVSDA